VVTVPAYFTDNQKSSTKDACSIAGLECKRLITEPVAAAMAFGLEKSKEGRKKCVVFDFGGGTHDVTVLEIHKKKINVKAVDGDPNLGGQDIDIELMKYCLK